MNWEAFPMNILVEYPAMGRRNGLHLDGPHISASRHLLRTESCCLGGIMYEQHIAVTSERINEACNHTAIASCSMHIVRNMQK